MNPKDNLSSLKGVGPKTQKLFLALGISNVGELLNFFPRTYQIYPEPVRVFREGQPEGECAVNAAILNAVSAKKTRTGEVSIGTADVGGKKLELVWFNMPYIRRTVYPGKHYIFFGNLKITQNGSFKIEQPQVFKIPDYNRMILRPQPVYPLTKGLSNNAVKKAVNQVIDAPGLTEEYIPGEILRDRDLPGINYAYRQIHFPDSFESLTEGRRRLVYNEFFDFFVRMNSSGGETEKIKNPYPFKKGSLSREVYKRLPFSLTAGQNEALTDIVSDLRGEHVSQRLIQGDVGSGKTIIAFLAMLFAVENGYSAAIMAPTEVLAGQHYDTFNEYLKLFGLPFEAVLITGSVKGAKRKEINEYVSAQGGIFIVGTHALFSENMRYRDLALVITDEQHRFGVRQRQELSEKGITPHVLVMSATPIPRSLAMILYGDMNISVIKDVPAKKKPIKNSVIRPDKRPAAYDFIKKEIDSGHQAYVICPLVEASEKTEGENVSEYNVSLSEYYRGRVRTGVLHGRMTPDEKNRIMKEFADHKIDILVSTTVVEVGINVPNATVMLIEDANRFGLAQLHQLRGRVGRGEAQSFCIFMDTSDGGEIPERLKVIARSNDGFKIASEDLKSRGPGDFFGIRQSGEMNFSLADIFQDADVMREASGDARALMSEGPGDITEKIMEHLDQGRGDIYTNL